MVCFPIRRLAHLSTFWTWNFHTFFLSCLIAASCRVSLTLLILLVVSAWIITISKSKSIPQYHYKRNRTGMYKSILETYLSWKSTPYCNFLFIFNFSSLTLVLRSGGLNSFRPGAKKKKKKTQPRDKIATGTFQFILSPHYGEKIEPSTFPRGRVSFQS